MQSCFCCISLICVKVALTTKNNLKKFTQIVERLYLVSSVTEMNDYSFATRYRTCDTKGTVILYIRQNTSPELVMLAQLVNSLRYFQKLGEAIPEAGIELDSNKSMHHKKSSIYSVMKQARHRPGSFTLNFAPHKKAHIHLSMTRNKSSKNWTKARTKCFRIRDCPCRVHYRLP